MSISNKYFYFFIIIIFFIYISSRLFLLSSHFANHDDSAFEYEDLSDVGIEYGNLSNQSKNYLKIKIFKVH